MLGKLKEQWKVMWPFAVALFAISLIRLIVYRLDIYPNAIIDPFALLQIITIGYAGWTAVRKHHFKLKQVATFGLILFVAAIWIVPLMLGQLQPNMPLFAIALTLLVLFVLNLVIVMVAAVLGGWLASRTRRR